MNNKDTNEEFNSVRKPINESSKNSDQPTDQNDSSLEALLREQQSEVSQRLRISLGREPTQKEIDNWLNEHTEGY